MRRVFRWPSVCGRIVGGVSAAAGQSANLRYQRNNVRPGPFERLARPCRKSNRELLQFELPTRHLVRHMTRGALSARMITLASNRQGTIAILVTIQPNSCTLARPDPRRTAPRRVRERKVSHLESRAVTLRTATFAQLITRRTAASQRPPSSTSCGCFHRPCEGPP